MIENTLICFLIFSEPNIGINIQLVCVEEKTETITDVQETVIAKT
jgi:hypothetical protein